MKEYIILGADPTLNDIFDLIHAKGDRVAAVYLNMDTPPPKRGPTIRERIQAQPYSIALHTSLTSFRPATGHSYIQGLNSPKKQPMIESLKQQFNLNFEPLIHPEAHLGSNVKIGEGVFVNARATIAPNAVLDHFCSINRAASIGHDAYIGKYTRIGPNAALAGGTHMGNNCSIGISASILDYVEIGNWSVIGAGSVVTKDIPEGQIALGVPAKIVKENNNRI